MDEEKTDSYNRYEGPDPVAGSYSPPAQTPQPWTGSSWQPQTPPHWLEPLPGQERRNRRRRGRTGLTALMVVVVALIAGGIGSLATYGALYYGGAINGGQQVAAEPTATPQPQPQPTPQTVVLDEQTAITAAAESVSPAVVTITVSGEATDPFTLPSTGVGSGIIYDTNGWILTNRHVVADATSLSVELHDGREVVGTVYGIDTLTDLAIVKIDAPDLVAAPIGDSSQLKPGQTAVVIGSALGTFTNSVTSGVVSALGRQLVVTDEATGQRRRLRNLIQTDAAINPGNSGGPLIDAAGHVVGVSTAYAEQAQGIFFAIPINIAKPIMRQAVAGETISRPYIGIIYVPIDRNVQEENELPIDYGAWIAPETSGGGDPIVPGSPADNAGLREGDIVTAIDGRQIDASLDLDDILTNYVPGDRVTLDILRGGATMQIGVTLAERPANV